MVKYRQQENIYPLDRGTKHLIMVIHIVSGEKDNGGVLPKLKTCSQNDLLCHWRYKYDPPEFQTLLASVDDSSTFHIGYFRDDPKEMPVFVASAGGIKKEETFSQGFSSHAKINPMGGNLFGAVYNYIQALILKAEPFQQTALHKIKESLHVHATMKNTNCIATVTIAQIARLFISSSKTSIVYVIKLLI